MPTTIAVSSETKELLRQLGEKGESYDTIIRRLLHEAAWKRLDADGNTILEYDEFIPLDALSRMYRVLVSSTFQKGLLLLDPESRSRVRNALEHLTEDPFTSRAHADSKALKDTEPKKYRLGIGRFRVVYAVFENEIRVIELFSRKRVYRL